MEQQEMLSCVFNNPKYSDKEVTGRLLNTILENNNTDKDIYEQIIFFVKLIDKIKEEKHVERKDISFIVDSIKQVNDFNSFELLLKAIYKQNMQDNHKMIFLMCFCRSIFATHYNQHILYTNIKYAVMEAEGQEMWSVFLEAFDNNEYVYKK
jgi:hypothetical protein